MTVAACRMRCNAEAGCAGFEHRRSWGKCKLCGNDVITRTNKQTRIKRSGEYTTPAQQDSFSTAAQEAQLPPIFDRVSD